MGIQNIHSWGFPSSNGEPDPIRPNLLQINNYNFGQNIKTFT